MSDRTPKRLALHWDVEEGWLIEPLAHARPAEGDPVEYVRADFDQSAVGLIREIAGRSPLGTSSEAQVTSMAKRWLRENGCDASPSSDLPKES